MSRPGVGCASRTCGFTLIELLVVISIIAVLISMLLPTLGAAREQASRVACASGMRQMSIGVVAYAEDHDTLVPGRSSYEVHTGNYFRITFGGAAPKPSIFASEGDFAGIYAYATNPDLYYCPSGVLRHTDPVAGNPNWTNFFSYQSWRGGWMRFISYDYLGAQINDHAGRSPPVDINGKVHEYPQRLGDRGDLVLMADISNWRGPPGQATHYLSNHPGCWGDCYDYRDGANVAHFDTSVRWKNEEETVPTYFHRANSPNQWWMF